jgi:predicted amidophosphoribosyltransferase
LKYRNRRAAAGWLAAGMAALVAGWVDAAGLAVVTWAPTTPARAARRGFDQAELLARPVARRLGLPCLPLLTRLPGPAQTGRSGPERRLPTGFAPGPAAARLGPGRSPPHVLVVDDVATTGATLAAAARVLRGAGAGQVSAVVAGRRL